MASSIGIHFENIELKYLQKNEFDLYEVCMKMCSFPNTFRVCASIWWPCTMTGIFADTLFLKAHILR